MPLAPGIQETPEVANKNVIASMHGLRVRGVTIPAGTADIVPGQVLGKITATGKYGHYADAGAGGLDVAVAIALNFAPLDAVRDQVIHVAIGGHLVLDQLLVLTAAAIVDFAGRSDVAMNEFHF